MRPLVRPARPEDAAAIADIHNESILAGGATMETEPKTAEGVRTWIDSLNEREAVVVAALDGAVVGWGVLKKWSPRPGYRTTGETSIFVRRALARCGVGSALKEELIARAEELGYHHLAARIIGSNAASIGFYRRFGYELVGVQRETGFLDGKWEDTAIMGLRLGRTGDPPGLPPDPGAGRTRRLLEEAGIRRGMRVLDVGCGRGDVTLLLAELVGPGGAVLGVDRSGAALEVARAKVDSPQVAFLEGDFASLGAEQGLFDAAVGRRVLMVQPDPVEAVRGIAAAVRPGGLVFFEEIDSRVPPTSGEPLPLHAQVRTWIWEALESVGAHPSIGFDLFPVLVSAGLLGPRVRAEAGVHTPETGYPMVGILRRLLPRILALGLATEADVGIDTLQERLADERRAAPTSYISELTFAAWARKPE